MLICRSHLHQTHLFVLALGWVVATAGTALAAGEAGRFQFVSGQVRVVSASGAARVPLKGDAVNEGDSVVTGARAIAQIRMRDGGLISVRSDTHLRIDQFVFNGHEDGAERSFISLLRGGFRAITGLIGQRNKDNYGIRTPTATIGIRGTDHEPVVVPAGAASAKPGTYDRVYRGVVILRTDTGDLLVNPNQIGFAAGRHVAPVLLPKVPELYNPGSAAAPARAKPSAEGQSPADEGATSRGEAKILRTPLDAPAADLTSRMPQGAALEAGPLPPAQDAPANLRAKPAAKTLGPQTLTGPGPLQSTPAEAVSTPATVPIAPAAPAAAPTRPEAARTVPKAIIQTPVQAPKRP